MRRATVILWLMLALLPLRGWAVASMGMDMPAAAVSAAADAAATTPGSPMPACHEAGDDGSLSANCQACDWCHAALGLSAQITATASPAPAVQPASAVARDTGRRAVGGLDRPPRPHLA
jgi:hypothetical protein